MALSRPPFGISIIIVAFALITYGVAQTILPSSGSATFPQCALSCETLVAAQNSCLPPAAPVSDQSIYTSCFCESALLTQLHTSPDGTCDANCPGESDRQLLENWYNSFCNSGTTTTTTAGGTNSATTMSTVTAGVTTEIVLLPSTVTPSSTAASSTSTGSDSYNTPEYASASNSSWMHTHWRWILMIIVVIVGLVLITLLAICFKRRHRRKVEEKRATLSGFAAPPSSSRGRTPEPNIGQDLWGPHQHMAHTRGWEYNHEQEDAAAGNAGVLGGDAEKRGSRKAGRPKNRHGSGVEVSEIGSTDKMSANQAREPDWYKGKRVAKKSRTGPAAADIIEKM